jgi:hypothetical protein
MVPRMGLRWIFFAMLMASLAIACGDPPLCPSETVLLIDRSPVVIDSDLVRPGVQTTIVVRTSLRAGVPIALEVFDGSGNVAATSEGVTDEAGEASFANVSVTSPRAKLHVRADDAICGVVEEEVEIDVLVGGDCVFVMTPLPLSSAFYAPIDVYNTTTDRNAEPGHQVEVVAQTLPSALVAVFASGTQGDALLGTEIATSGIAKVPVTLPEGQVALRVTCTLAGTTLASPATTIVVDTVAPECIVTAPSASIPITPDADLDGDLGNGIQLLARAQVAGSDVIGEPAEFHVSELGGVTSIADGTVVDGLGNTSAALLLDPTITPAHFEVAVVAQDHAGNSATCESSLSVILTFVSFAPPAADGEVSSNDGTVSGATLTFPLCGTVTRDDATVAVTVDGNSPIAATISGRTWCTRVSVDERDTPHAIVATATVGTDVGTESLSLRVDVTPPTQVGAFAARAVDRQRIEVEWLAPSDAGGAAASYIARLATVPLTEANFDTTGMTLLTGTPKAPGTTETLAIAPVRTGTTFFFGIAAIDSFGNRGPVALSGPLQPHFTQTGAITPLDANDGLLRFGSAIAHGRFNDDDFTDVAIGAPDRNDGAAQSVGAVYVFFGGSSGIGKAPDLVIKGEIAQGRFGAALTALHRSSMTREDLVVGAPGGDGGLFIYQGGAAFGTGTRLASTAGARIGVDTTNPGWFASSGLGHRLVTADVDGDGLQDLVASAPTGDGGAGGVAILYGGTIGNEVHLSDLDPTGSGSTVVELIRDPGAGPSRGLGFYLWSVGPTEGLLDVTDDLVIVYSDDQTTAGDSLFVFRGDGARPVAPGVNTRGFIASRDVRVDFVTATVATDWGSAVATIQDQDGDGARELVVSAYRQNRTVIITGDVLSANGVVTTNDPGVVRTTLNGGASVSRLGVAIANNDRRSTGDIDGDGREDLVIGGTQDGTAKLFIWFGGTIPTGTVTASSAAFVNPLGAPNTWRAPGKGQGGVAAWVGDTNGDGLDDICVASPTDNSSDGLFEVLFDEGP